MKRIESITRCQSNLRAIARTFSPGGLSPSRTAVSLLGRPQLLSRSSPLRYGAAPQAATRRWYSAPNSLETEVLQKTPLHDLHLAHGAKMVPFGGFHMPVQYSSLSVSASHAFTRSHASLFDVSHMVQRVFHGKDVVAFLQRITPSNLEALPMNKSTLSTFLHPETGGIVDDTIITRTGESMFYIVTNAACREKDDAYLEAEMKAFRVNRDPIDVNQSKLDGQGLIALQGPLSAEVLDSVLYQGDHPNLDLAALHFGSCTKARVKLLDGTNTHKVLISRGGYTGEDGFEISIDGGQTAAVVETLLAKAGPEKLQLAGLGARDSLRLEAGMCLYGHDLDDTTTPVEGGLSWIIPPERRAADAGFHGADVISKQLVLKSKGGSGVERRRVGFVVEGAPAREGAEIVSKEGEKIGNITSGCPSPTLGKNIAMGYIKTGFHKSGTEVDVIIRGRNRKATVTKMPFVPTKYWKGIAPA